MAKTPAIAAHLTTFQTAPDEPAPGDVEPVEASRFVRSPLAKALTGLDHPKTADINELVAAGVIGGLSESDFRAACGQAQLGNRKSVVVPTHPHAWAAPRSDLTLVGYIPREKAAMRMDTGVRLPAYPSHQELLDAVSQAAARLQAAGPWEYARIAFVTVDAPKVRYVAYCDHEGALVTRTAKRDLEKRVQMIDATPVYTAEDVAEDVRANVAKIFAPGPAAGLQAARRATGPYQASTGHRTASQAPAGPTGAAAGPALPAAGAGAAGTAGTGPALQEEGGDLPVAKVQELPARVAAIPGTDDPSALNHAMVISASPVVSVQAYLAGLPNCKGIPYLNVGLPFHAAQLRDRNLMPNGQLAPGSRCFIAYRKRPGLQAVVIGSCAWFATDRIEGSRSYAIYFDPNDITPCQHLVVDLEACGIPKIPNAPFAFGPNVTTESNFASPQARLNLWIAVHGEHP